MIYAGILVLCPFFQKSESLMDNSLNCLSSHSSLILKNILKDFYIFWTWFYSVIWKPWDKNLSQEIMSFLCLCLTSLACENLPSLEVWFKNQGKSHERFFLLSKWFIHLNSRCFIHPTTHLLLETFKENRKALAFNRLWCYPWTNKQLKYFEKLYSTASLMLMGSFKKVSWPPYLSLWIVKWLSWSILPKKLKL